MKFINKLATGLLFFVAIAGNSQIKDSVDVAQNVSVNSNQRQKIDGVIATVGDYIILESDIDKTILEMAQQGNAITDVPRCQVLGLLMEDKLYAHHAIQDSIVITDAQVKEKLNKQMEYMVEQLKSVDNVVKYFKKNSEEEFRTDLSEII